MRFRPLVGYLILVGATVIVSLATIRLAMYQKQLSIFFGGAAIGIGVGYFMARHAWRAIQTIMTTRSQMSIQEGKDLLGHWNYRWLFEGWIAFIILVFLVVPVDSSDFVIQLIAVISGGFSGAMCIYFLALALLTVKEEVILKRRIVISVE